MPNIANPTPHKSLASESAEKEKKSALKQAENMKQDVPQTLALRRAELLKRLDKKEAATGKEGEGKDLDDDEKVLLHQLILDLYLVVVHYAHTHWFIMYQKELIMNLLQHGQIILAQLGITYFHV